MSAGVREPGVELALDPGYWASLAAAVHDGAVDDDVDAAVDPDGVDDDDDTDTLAQVLASDGFAIVPDAVAPRAVARARRAVDVVTAAGWPRVFAWMLDDVWACARAPRVHAALAAALGDGYLQLPGMWLHEVPATPGARGWGPHTDTAGREPAPGAPRRLTAWLALTDATTDNGCIMYVPAHATTDLADRFEHMERMTTAETLHLLREARAAPARAGTLLLWRTDVLHWGAVATTNARERRLALSFEAAHEDAAPRADEQPALAPVGVASFAERLSVVGRGLLAYGRSAEREPYAHRFLALGEELCDRWL